MRPDTHARLAYSIPRFCAEADIGRSTVYQEIAAGRLRTVKVGKRTLIPAEEAHAWLRRLASEASGRPEQQGNDPFDQTD